MAISFVGSSNVANGLAQGTSAVVPRPPGVVNGDFLLAFISIGNVGAVVPPAGWADIPLGTFTAPNLQCRAYWKVAAGEPVSWTWTFPNTSYVGIAHATRGVGAVFGAAQGDDGLSLLAHTTPVVAAPSGGWLVSSWTGRNLLALGWAPPAGDTERQDVTGGLIILLNVSHAVDDTNASVVAGNYSKTTNSLIAVRALDALVSLSPLLDPLLAVPVDGRAVFDTSVLGVGLLADPLDTFAVFGAATLGLGLLPASVDTVQDFGVSVVVPGEVFLFPLVLDGRHLLSVAEVVPGEVVLGGMPLVTVQDFGASSVEPGEVVLLPPPVTAVDDFDGPHEVMLGFAISDFSVDFYAVFGDALLGRQIGSDVEPFLVPNPFVVDTFEHVGAAGLIFNSVAASGPCC